MAGRSGWRTQPDQMVGLAETIIDKMSGEFESEKFEDRYENAMIELIRSKEGAPGMPAHFLTAYVARSLGTGSWLTYHSAICRPVTKIVSDRFMSMSMVRSNISTDAEQR